MCAPILPALAAIGTFAGSAAGLGTAIVGGTALAGAGMLQQRAAQKSQNRAQRENIAAQERANANAQKAEANKRRMPNYGAIFDRNTVKSGVSATMLTGAGGVTNGLTLGRNSLLG